MAKISEFTVGPICNSMAASSLCFKSCEEHSVLKTYNGGLWENIHMSRPIWPEHFSRLHSVHASSKGSNETEHWLPTDAISA